MGLMIQKNILAKNCDGMAKSVFDSVLIVPLSLLNAPPHTPAVWVPLAETRWGQ